MAMRGDDLNAAIRWLGIIGSCR